MATNSFDIANIFRSAFGVARGVAAYKKSLRQKTEYDSDKIKLPVGRNVEAFDDLPSIDFSEDEFGSMRDILGSNLPDGRALFMPVKIGELLLPNEPTIFITRKKRIVSTALVGSERKGTVKELIGHEDTELTIRGIAINYDNTKIYPEKIVKDIDELYNLDEALEIKCALTSLLKIYRVVIKSISFPQMVGIQHAQAYELKCVSDEDFILEL